MREGDGRILAGPWLGEVGWEVLYWIPLLEWAAGEWPELRSRLVAVSRGGVAGWYHGAAAEYVDLFELYDHAAFSRNLEAEREGRRAEGKNRLKQAGETDWEREVAARVGAMFGEDSLPMLHPSDLYSDPGAKKRVRMLAQSADGFPRWSRPERGPLADVLPERYVALRFYASRMTKDELGTQVAAERFADAATRALAERTPVVSLNPGLVVDPQHPDFGLGDGLASIAAHASFANNLELQSIAIANATAFVGTFGGLAYVGPRYGVPSVSFWVSSPRGTPEGGQGPWRDLALADAAFNRSGRRRFTVRQCGEAPVEELLAPALGTGRRLASRRVPRLRPRSLAARPSGGAASEARLAPVVKNPGIRVFDEHVSTLLRESDGRILAGPWMGEVGWEVLYWIPLLRWAVERRPELRHRLVAVSRGGVAGWYEGVAADYVDLLDLYDNDTFTRRMVGHGKALTKQRRETEWELEVAEAVGARFGEPPLAMLHPSELYQNAGSKKHVLTLAARGEFVPWRRPDRGPLDDVLPPSYVAVRFYGSAMTVDENQSQETAEAFAEAATRFIGQHCPVVRLNPGMVIDPLHPDFAPRAEVIELAPHLSMASNLAIQSIAIANATAFVGTFGGLAFVPPYYGVPSVSFWITNQRGLPETSKGPWRDLAIAQAVFNRPGWGGLTARSYDEAPLEELLAPVVGNGHGAGSRRRRRTRS